jgi:hypothetical protein
VFLDLGEGQDGGDFGTARHIIMEQGLSKSFPLALTPMGSFLNYLYLPSIPGIQEETVEV